MTRVLDFDHCLAVTYKTRTFAETGEVRHALAGNGPLIVNRRTGAIRQGVASRAVEEQLDNNLAAAIKT